MKGLIFSEPMVKAWLEGRKTVTRRLMKKQPEFDADGCQSAGLENPPVWFDIYDLDGDLMRVKTPYRPGETVYIKETWGIHPSLPSPVYYKADGPVRFISKWKSPRFMPEWAARSHALIVSVRPERVQEITEGEAILEGFMFAGHGDDWMRHDSFRVTWDKFHPGSWDRNDWVWRIELEKQGRAGAKA